MSEAKFCGLVKKSLPQVHWTRIENSVGSGMPDLNGCINGIEFWVELKLVLPAGVLLRPMQYAWSHVRHRYGGRIFILAMDERKKLIHLYRPPYKIEECGKYLRLINDPLTTIERPFNWNSILSQLCHVPSSVN